MLDENLEAVRGVKGWTGRVNAADTVAADACAPEPWQCYKQAFREQVTNALKYSLEKYEQLYEGDMPFTPRYAAWERYHALDAQQKQGLEQRLVGADCPRRSDFLVVENRPVHVLCIARDLQPQLLAAMRDADSYLKGRMTAGNYRKAVAGWVNEAMAVPIIARDRMQEKYKRECLGELFLGMPALMQSAIGYYAKSPARVEELTGGRGR